MKKVTEINQTETAKRKLKSIAKNNNLPEDFVTILFNYNWDLDPLYRNEPTGWVRDEQRKQVSENQFEKDLEVLTRYLEIDNTVFFRKNFIAEQLISVHYNINQNDVNEKLLIAGENKNYAYLSEYSSYHYLNNLSVEKLIHLAPKGEYDNRDLMLYLFYKIFRGGAIERGNLFYCYTDLCFKLPYQKKLKYDNNWIAELTKKINNSENATLSDLIAFCKNLVQGDKYFKQEILQALSYSGRIKVANVNVSDIFIPDFLNVLSKHFYSNEWTYPLRMWNENN